MTSLLYKFRLNQMSTISEFTLFKECVHNPRYLDANLSQLNLSFIRDPNSTEDPNAEPKQAVSDSLEVKQRKALRLFNMTWSGVTKCIRNIV